jgi:hypothetical protein
MSLSAKLVLPLKLDFHTRVGVLARQMIATSILSQVSIRKTSKLFIKRCTR